MADTRLPMMLAYPREVVNSFLQHVHRVSELPQRSIAMMAQQAADIGALARLACVSVVHMQSAFFAGILAAAYRAHMTLRE